MARQAQSQFERSRPESPFGSLIPDSLAQYRPIILSAIDYFIDQLPDDRRSLLEQRWASLPCGVPAEIRILELLQLCPTLHKLGQVLARERRLPTELRRQLQRLETMPPWTPATQIRETLFGEFGGTIPQGLVVADHAIAEASIAVVVPFVWNSSFDEHIVQGVFKVLKPGVAGQIEEELQIWRSLGAFLDETCETMGAPALEYEDTFRIVIELLEAEVRFDVEQSNLKNAAESLAGVAHVVVPQLLPFCTPVVTAMTYLPGRKVTDATSLDAQIRRRLACTLTEALLIAPMFSAERTATFHADPHAGNLLATEDGQLGILDWSLVGRLQKNHRELLSQIVLGAITRDVPCIARAIDKLTLNAADGLSLRYIVESALSKLEWPNMPGLDWFLALLDAVVFHAKVRFSSDLVLFRKMMLMLEGVLHDVDATFCADDVIAAAVLRQLAAEWPMRMFVPPSSRAFRTHLSNADLAAACAKLPAAALDSWNRAWQSSSTATQKGSAFAR